MPADPTSVDINRAPNLQKPGTYSWQRQSLVHSQASTPANQHAPHTTNLRSQASLSVSARINVLKLEAAVINVTLLVRT